MSVNRFVQHSESGEPDRGPDSYTAPIWRVDDLGWVAGLDSLVAVLSDCGDDSRLLAASRGFLEAIGVTECVFRIPSAPRDVVLPILDQQARLVAERA